MPPFLDCTSARPSAAANAHLIDAMLPAAPGAIVQLNLGINLLFVGCGEGATLGQLATLFPRSRFVGVDACLEALRSAQESARESGRSNIQLGQPNILRRAALQGVFNYVIRVNATAGVRLESLPVLMRDGALLFDVSNRFCSPSAYHDAGLIIIRTFRLPDGRACTLAGNWMLPPSRN